MKKITLLFASLIMLVALAIPTAAFNVNAYSGIPTFTIVSNIPDQKVTILASNFPANYDFQVLMGAYGTLGVGGTMVATTNSGTGGAFQATYTIPAILVGSQRIAILSLIILFGAAGGSFHWALLLLMVAAFVGTLQRSEGSMAIAVGETKADVPASSLDAQLKGIVDSGRQTLWRAAFAEAGRI